jgi:Pyruvate/2-oxoacid:ferredoxin oxidoreductase delta subunit
MKPVLIKNKCYVQKEICTAIKACPSGTITFLDDEAEPLGGKIIFEMDKCTGCGLCAKECCGNAIKML